MIVVAPIQPVQGRLRAVEPGVYAKHVQSLTADRQTIEDCFHTIH